MIDRRPALIARCSSAQDVVAAVNLAREQHLPLSVYGGGHGVTGAAMCDAGICVDLRGMQNVTVDPDQRVAIAEGGATWGDVRRGDTGTRARGHRRTRVDDRPRRPRARERQRLARAQVRLRLRQPDRSRGGHRRRAHRHAHPNDENPDLFWGLRGGGGNFGIVTKFHLRVHPLGPIVLGGMLMHPVERRAPNCCASTATSWPTRPTRSGPGSRSSPRRPRSSCPNRCAGSP